MSDGVDPRTRRGDGSGAEHSEPSQDPEDDAGATSPKDTESGAPAGREHGDANRDPHVGPHPDQNPEQVVDLLREEIEATEAAGEESWGERRRRALQGEAGAYRLAFDLASPQFRSAHGDLVAFAAAMADPVTQPLFDAETVERGPIELDGEEAVVTVLARPPADAERDDERAETADGDDETERDEIAGSRRRTDRDATPHTAAEPRTYDLTLRRQPAGKYAGCWMLDRIDMVYVGASPRFRRMPTVEFAGETVRCEAGERLRDVLLEAEGLTPHNDAAQVANCGGNGLCGTCAVEVEGETDEPGRRERRRLSLPPFSGEDGLRLSCQTCVEGDVEVAKHGGLWGQHREQVLDDAAETDAGDEEPDDGPPAGDSIEVTPAEYGGTYEYDPATLGDRGGAAAGGGDR